MSLTEILKEKVANSKKNIPAEKREIMDRAIALLEKESLATKALGVGDILPDFHLPNAKGETISLSSFKNDYLVVSFYRGGWCPYCNLELKALQDVLPQLSDLNTSLVAISPELPDSSLTTTEKNELTFEVLSDVDNIYAKSLGLVFQLPEDLITLYNSFNLQLAKHNGNEDYELPMPATYVLNENYEIIYSFVTEDYKERLDPEKILETIKGQK